jgi:hypothetical protein
VTVVSNLDFSNATIAIIPLSRGYVALVDLCDADLAQFSWNAHEDHGNVYARRNQWYPDGSGVTHRLHRVIMERMLGRPLSSKEWIDHKNNQGLDCRRENLRLASPNQNTMNSRVRRDNPTGLKGVAFRRNRNKWYATINVNGKQIYLGSYATPELAHRAYVDAAIKFFGEFAHDGFSPLGVNRE